MSVTSRSLCIAFSAAFCLGLLTAGCDWTVDDEFGGPTLLEVQVFPETVTPGDTALFVAQVADSTDPSLRFEWRLANRRQALVTDTAQVTWVAPNEPGSFTHRVIATVDVGTDSTSQSSGTASDDLEFTVIVDPLLSGEGS